MIYVYDLDDTLTASPALRAMVPALRAAGHVVNVCTGNPHAVSVLASLGLKVDAVKIVPPPHAVNKAEYLAEIGADLLVDNSAGNCSAAPCPTLRFTPAMSTPIQRSTPAAALLLEAELSRRPKIDLSLDPRRKATQ